MPYLVGLGDAEWRKGKLTFAVPISAIIKDPVMLTPSGVEIITRRLVRYVQENPSLRDVDIKVDSIQWEDRRPAKQDFAAHVDFVVRFKVVVPSKPILDKIADGFKSIVVGALTEAGRILGEAAGGAAGGAAKGLVEKLLDEIGPIIVVAGGVWLFTTWRRGARSGGPRPVARKRRRR